MSKPKKNRIKIVVRTADGCTHNVNIDDATDAEVRAALNVGMKPPPEVSRKRIDSNGQCGDAD